MVATLGFKTNPWAYPNTAPFSNSSTLSMLTSSASRRRSCREKISADLTFAEGYEGFLSRTRSNSRGRFAYSGVATFCLVKPAFGSNEVALPVAAEEGFTGLLEDSTNMEMVTGDFAVELPLNVDGLEDVTSEDLVKVDSKG